MLYNLLYIVMELYNTKYICMYDKECIFKCEDFDESDKQYIRDEFYRNDLVGIFGLKLFDEEKINNSINNIYNKIKDYEPLDKILLKMSSRFFCEDKELGLMVLFSYDYLRYFHPCLCDFLENGTICQEKLSNLYEKSQYLCK